MDEEKGTDNTPKPDEEKGTDNTPKPDEEKNSLAGIEELAQRWVDNNNVILKKLKRLAQRRVDNNDVTLKNLESELSKIVNKQAPGYDRLKAYMENAIKENNIDMEKWMAEKIMAMLKFVLSVLAVALGLKSNEINFFQCGWLSVVLFLLVVALCCIVAGIVVETPIRRKNRKQNFYKICLIILKYN